MRTITALRANDDWTLDVFFNDGAERRFDVKPLLDAEAFTDLKNIGIFKRVHNGGYFVEWDNEADLSADTLYLEEDQHRWSRVRATSCAVRRVEAYMRLITHILPPKRAV